MAVTPNTVNDFFGIPSQTARPAPASAASFPSSDDGTGERYPGLTAEECGWLSWARVRLGFTTARGLLLVEERKRVQEGARARAVARGTTAAWREGAAGLRSCRVAAEFCRPPVDLLPGVLVSVVEVPARGGGRVQERQGVTTKWEADLTGKLGGQGAVVVSSRRGMLWPGLGAKQRGSAREKSGQNWRSPRVASEMSRLVSGKHRSGNPCPVVVSHARAKTRLERAAIRGAA